MPTLEDGSEAIMFAPRTREELIAACSARGLSPFNNMTREVEGRSP